MRLEEILLAKFFLKHNDQFIAKKNLSLVNYFPKNLKHKSFDEKTFFFRKMVLTSKFVVGMLIFDQKKEVD